MMRSISLFRIIAAGLAAALGAAPGQAQGYDWSGFHIGVNAAAVQQRVESSGTAQINNTSNLVFGPIFVVPATTGTFDSSTRDESLTGGGQIGFQKQFGGLVAGLEGDVTAMRRTERTSQSLPLPATLISPAGTATIDREVRFSREWSARARLGAGFGRNLVYATGGIAGARVRITRSDTFATPAGSGAAANTNSGASGPTVSSDSARRSPTGWTAGLGFERALSNNLSIGIEFRRTDLGSQDIAFASASATITQGAIRTGANGGSGTQGNIGSAPTRIDLESNAVGLRLNLRF